MCHYIYYYNDCGHGTFVFLEDIESCPNRLLHPNGPDQQDSIDCPFVQAECGGMVENDCQECGESEEIEWKQEEI